MADRRRSQHVAPRASLALVVLSVLAAGCMDDRRGPPGDGDDQEPTVQPLFDGGRTYELALSQLYDDPADLAGPRYRIPGTETSAAVADELRAALADALGGSGRAWISDLDGTDYYRLDLGPVRNYLCGSDDEARARVRETTFRNIVGRTHQDEVGLIIGAHWDSKRHADSEKDPARRDQPILGADDGAGATAAVIELARAFTEQDPGIALTYVLFDGEDGFARDDCHPLAGSLHFAQSIPADQRDTVLGMILLDMVGNASATYYREANSLSYTVRGETIESSWLGDAVWEKGAALGFTAFVDEPTGAVIDDHIPFLHEGIPSLDVIRYEHGFAPYWHTTRDDHTAIAPEGLEQTGRAVELAVHHLAATRWDDA